ncbi:MAG: hypothetical protein IPK67_12385 [Planctomycetes bacterium]|nr:hypothetical protein [Planctomycetota bacterium]
MITNLLRTAAVVAALAPGLFAQQQCWTEATDNVNILPGILPSCNAGGLIADNQFWRLQPGRARPERQLRRHQRDDRGRAVPCRPRRAEPTRHHEGVP